MSAAPSSSGVRVRVRPDRAPSRPGPVPEVSVVIPCHNYGRYLPECLASVLDQQGVSVRAIVIDDASTDDSPDRALELARGDDRIQVIEHHYNRGPVHTFNHGLALADGEFVVRLDADDLLTPGSLARAVAVARAFPEVGLVYGHPVHFDDGRLRRRASRRVTGWTVWPGRSWLADRCRSGFNTITSPEALMRRSVVSQVGGQQPNLAYTHDMEMWLRIATISDVAYLHGADQAWHREHPASLSAREVTPLGDLWARHDAFHTLFAGAASELPEAGELTHDSDRALAGEALERAAQVFDASRDDDARDLIDEYIAFAFGTYADAGSLGEWQAVRARLDALSAGRPVRPRFIAERVARRVRTDRSHQHWHRNGVYR